ncbi:MAG: GAF domain-containing protein [Bacteroides sp.]|jgi:GAF domain-containing protein|nr:GAF domain-containing protein [Bacteroides sp.]
MNTDRKDGRYQRLYEQLQGLLAKPGNRLSRMATLAALLSHKMDHFFWTGFYLLDEGKLIVGPYQGPVACQLLAKDTGVCWAGINQGQSIIVPDVHQFPGHIACDSRSNSEIVVPVYRADGTIEGVLDVDSRDFNAFDETDRIWLEKMVSLL